MRTLKDIEKRLAEIKEQLENDENADVIALEQEINTLTEERKALLQAADRRKKLLESIAEGRDAKVIDEFEAPSQNELKRRAEELYETGRMRISAAEARSVLLSTGTLAKPTSVSGITEPFNIISSIVDMVYVEDLTGVGSHKVAYMKSWQEAKDNVSPGTAPTTSDPVFRTAAINPFPMDVMTYVAKNLKKQTPLQYEEKVRRGALIALRKKMASWIINGNGSTQAYGIYNAVNTESEPEDIYETYLVAKDYDINEKTLRNIVFAYGGNENVVGSGPKLILNKMDLIAFGDVRGTNEKRAVYEITPDGSNPNIGVIRDGGLSVPYVICSDVTALTGSAKTGSARIKTMIYGEPYAYMLGLFGDYEIRVSEDYKFGEGLLTVKGEVMAGGNIIADKGFIVVTKKSTDDT